MSDFKKLTAYEPCGVEYVSVSGTSYIEQLKAENARLRDLVRDFDKCLDTALYLADSAGYQTMPNQKLFASLRSRMSELGVIE